MRPVDCLHDSFGRSIENLRVSVTDVCNFRCVYCMPEDPEAWLPREAVLSFDEIERLVRVFVGLGIRRIRLTGGEPTLRPRLDELVRRLSALRPLGLEEISLTTNGFRLNSLGPKLAAAGLDRVNVSLDSLDPVKFERITGRRALDRVLEGLALLESFPTLSPIKVNAVAIRGFTTVEDILAFARLARKKPYIIRFIEYMPLDSEGNWREEMVMTGREIRESIDREYPLVAAELEDPSETARRFRFADGAGEVGFINPVSEPFCESCNRIRLTADGRLRTCLFSIEETDLSGPLRSGAADADLAGQILAAVLEKELKHKINEGEAFRRASRSMSQIGG